MLFRSSHCVQFWQEGRIQFEWVPSQERESLSGRALESRELISSWTLAACHWQLALRHISSLENEKNLVLKREEMSSWNFSSMRLKSPTSPWNTTRYLIFISQRIYEICFTGFKILINQQFFKFQILAFLYSLIHVCFLSMVCDDFSVPCLKFRMLIWTPWWMALSHVTSVLVLTKPTKQLHNFPWGWK